MFQPIDINRSRNAPFVRWFAIQHHSTAGLLTAVNQLARKIIAIKAIATLIARSNAPTEIRTLRTINRRLCLNLIRRSIRYHSTNQLTIQIQRLNSAYLHHSRRGITAIQTALRTAKHFYSLHILQRVVIHILVQQWHAIQNHAHHRLINPTSQSANIDTTRHRRPIIRHIHIRNKIAHILWRNGLNGFYQLIIYHTHLHLLLRHRTSDARDRNLHIRQIHRIYNSFHRIDRGNE